MHHQLPIPEGWFFPNDAQAWAFYGDALRALVFEAQPESGIFEYACQEMLRHDNVMDAIGWVPDLAGALKTVGLSSQDVADELGVPIALVEEWERGRRPLPSAAAVQLCRGFGWPLGLLFRDALDWHNLTMLGMVRRAEEDGF